MSSIMSISSFPNFILLILVFRLELASKVLKNMPVESENIFLNVISFPFFLVKYRVPFLTPKWNMYSCFQNMDYIKPCFIKSVTFSMPQKQIKKSRTGMYLNWCSSYNNPTDWTCHCMSRRGCTSLCSQNSLLAEAARKTNQDSLCLVVTVGDS